MFFRPPGETSSRLLAGDFGDVTARRNAPLFAELFPPLPKYGEELFLAGV